MRLKMTVVKTQVVRTLLTQRATLRRRFRDGDCTRGTAAPIVLYTASIRPPLLLVSAFVADVATSRCTSIFTRGQYCDCARNIEDDIARRQGDKDRSKSVV